MTLETDLDQSRRERAANLKRGLPAVVFGCVAMLLLLYCTVLARPKIPARYRHECDQAMAEMGLLTVSGGQQIADVKTLTLDEQRQKLSRIEILLKRLLGDQPKDDLSHWQLGIVAEASAKLFAENAIESLRLKDSKKADTQLSQAAAEQKRAHETMEEIALSTSKESIEAKSWLLARALERPVRELAQLDSLRATAITILESSPTQRIGLVRLGQIRLNEAFSWESNLDLDQKRRFVQQAIELISKIESPSLVEQAFLAEALDAIDVEESIQVSIRATQAFFGESSTRKLSAEHIASVFGCLFRLGNTQEALALLSDKLRNLSTVDQAIARGLCSESCLRNMVCQIDFPYSGRRCTSSQSLLLAVRLDGESSAVIDTLIRLAIADDSDRLAVRANQAISEENAPELKHMLLAIRAALKEEWAVCRGELKKSLAGEIVPASLFISIASRLVEKGLLTSQLGSLFCEQINRVAPFSVNLWYSSAIFFDKHEELEKAAASLEKIRSKATENPRILEYLETLYSRLGKSDEVDRIRLERKELRKLKSP